MAFSSTDDYQWVDVQLSSSLDLIEESFGDHPLLFCASHNRRYTREDGSIKPGEPGTARAALFLAKISHGRCMIQNKGNQHPALRKLLKSNSYQNCTLVDLHGMRNIHGIDVCLGIGFSPSIENQALSQFFQIQLERRGFFVRLNHPFSASRSVTLTNYFQSMSQSAIQVEVARHIRDDCQRMDLLCMALKEACDLFYAYCFCGRN